MKKRLLPLFFLFLFLLPFSISAQEEIGHLVNFYVQSTYDLSQRKELEATLLYVSQKAYWYADKNWWESLSAKEQSEKLAAVKNLSLHFDEEIYPIETKYFGSEWSPGIDKDSRITILFHPMQRKAGGYFNDGDEYPKSENAYSNEREMVYLNTDYLGGKLEKSLLAHEFQHLISFNQKERKYGFADDTWLNEARSEYAITLVGYDKNFENSNLSRRVKDFLFKPYDSLTEWKGFPYDYGVADMFIQYFVEHYGKQVIIDALHSPKRGIESLNYALKKNGVKEDFSQIFTDWTIAVLVNDCSLSPRYCYLDKNLNNFKLNPMINYLPFVGKGTLSVSNTTKDWSGNWHEFIGGNGTLELDFSASPGIKFEVPYIIKYKSGKLSIRFLHLDKKGRGEVNLPDFGSKIDSLTIIPSAQQRTSGFAGYNPSYVFSWTVKTVPEENIQLKKELLARIQELKREIAILQRKLGSLLERKISCGKLEENLYYGKKGREVFCLQQFLKSQGKNVYPEGLVTGNFLSLTKRAVIRFQEKHKRQILVPLGLSHGTGFVGPRTRSFINTLLGY